jgi:hypothetical protein
MPGMEEVGFVLTEILGLEEIGFGLTGLEWKKSVLV